MFTDRWLMTGGRFRSVIGYWALAIQAVTTESAGPRRLGWGEGPAAFRR
jgi:hypothetical protein